jgi:hypothetical protein
MSTESRCVTIAILLVLGGACSHQGGAGIHVQLENASAGPIADVQVSWNGGVFRCGDLAPGQACETEIVPRTESAPSVAYVRAGRKVVRQVDVYLGRGLGGALTITVQNNDQVVWRDAISVAH